ncbi:CbtA family protein [Pseudohalocynthiibacter aestuariivivens]|uniref:CbtA family protein n=1 Tax=Pseudohalocynthiibacter aestuariivivens TaxID=1591409 RepID=A0ABV5JHD4_9RHOB|nr:CbtA family protein [Pseudohalocynthiibacter aestuariivivens]MBS9715434.1 CbtA family protein [Pseudohalocynthiibacter aestuariivivens]
MTLKLLSSAVFAGFAAGLIAVLLQFWLVTPLLLEGEEYETGAKTHFEGVLVVVEDSEGNIVAPEEEAAEVAEEEENLMARHATTFFMNMVVFSGFGLILVAGFALAAQFGHQVTFHSGMVWGLAGFIAVQLAPAAGLYPELPGTPADNVVLRQYWWMTTVVTTITGIAFVVFGRGLVYIVIGAALLAAPHIIGAPHLPYYAGFAPPELSALFVSRTLFVMMIAWVVLGGVAGYFWHRQTD